MFSDVLLKKTEAYKHTLFYLSEILYYEMRFTKLNL
jgi:hypothetical protein